MILAVTGACLVPIWVIAYLRGPDPLLFGLALLWVAMFAGPLVVIAAVHCCVRIGARLRARRARRRFVDELR